MLLLIHLAHSLSTCRSRSCSVAARLLTHAPNALKQYFTDPKCSHLVVKDAEMMGKLTVKGDGINFTYTALNWGTSTPK